MAETAPFDIIETRSGARAMRDRRTGEIMHPLSGPLEEPTSLSARMVTFPVPAGSRMG
jgi:hypothetical protein